MKARLVSESMIESYVYSLPLACVVFGVVSSELIQFFNGHSWYVVPQKMYLNKFGSSKGISFKTALKCKLCVCTSMLGICLDAFL